MVVKKSGRVILTVVVSLFLAACVSPNEIAMEIGKPPKLEEGKSTLSLRAIQTRRYDTLDEKRLLAAATQSFQDLGYTVTESSLASGVLVGSKQRDAEESGQIAGQVILTLFAAALGSFHNPTWDQSQTILITLTTSPIKNSKQSDVRVSFDRRLVNNHGHLWRTEVITDAKIYQEFFEKFSSSAFLEAHTL